MSSLKVLPWRPSDSETFMVALKPGLTQLLYRLRRRPARHESSFDDAATGCRGVCRKTGSADAVALASQFDAPVIPGAWARR
jgi:hypothetical protein